MSEAGDDFGVEGSGVGDFEDVDKAGLEFLVDDVAPYGLGPSPSQAALVLLCHN